MSLQMRYVVSERTQQRNISSLVSKC